MRLLPGTHIFDTTMTVQQCVQSDQCDVGCCELAKKDNKSVNFGLILFRATLCQDHIGSLKKASLINLLTIKSYMTFI